MQQQMMQQADAAAAADDDDDDDDDDDAGRCSSSGAVLAVGWTSTGTSIYNQLERLPNQWMVDVVTTRCHIVTLLSLAGPAPAASGDGLSLLQSAQHGEAGKALAFIFPTYNKK
jgi:hypothetical protein